MKTVLCSFVSQSPRSLPCIPCVPWASPFVHRHRPPSSGFRLLLCAPGLGFGSALLYLNMLVSCVYYQSTESYRSKTKSLSCPHPWFPLDSAQDPEPVERASLPFNRIGVRLRLLMPRYSKPRMPAIVPQHQDTHFTPNDPKKQMIAEHVKPSSSNVVLEKAEVGRVRGYSILRRLHFGEKSVAQFGPTLPVKVYECELEIGLYRAVKTQLHLPSPRRS